MRSESFPGLMALLGPRGKHLGSGVPEREGGDEERTHTCDQALHTEQHHMYRCVWGGLSSPTRVGASHPDDQGGWAGQRAVFTQRAAASPEGGSRRVLLAIS